MSLHSSPLHKKGHPEHIGHSHIQEAFEDLKAGRLYSLSRQAMIILSPA